MFTTILSLLHNTYNVRISDSWLNEVVIGRLYKPRILL
jgi:hypothetical protein